MSAELMQAAAELAGLAGRTALRHWRSDLDIEEKGDGSPVTRADREAEQRARSWIRERFPADGILGEEYGDEPGTSGRRWILDPVDGTKSFVRGVPLWGSLVAVVEGEQVLAGAMRFPALTELIAAAPGEGCWHDGKRARVSAIESLSAARCSPPRSPACESWPLTPGSPAPGATAMALCWWPPAART